MAKKKAAPLTIASTELEVERKPLRLLHPLERSTTVPPPVETRSQEVLPFDKLTWEEFEHLCFRLASRAGDAEYWQLYGRRGQKQDGIDIYVRLRNGRYNSWQCKRYKKFQAADLKTAVDEFVKGKWSDKTETFFLCVQDTLDDTKLQGEIERQARRLKGGAESAIAEPTSAEPSRGELDSGNEPIADVPAAKPGIAFTPLGGAELSERLKPFPEIIDEFFGREWVRVYCGEDAVRRLGHRLTTEDYTKLRAELRLLYREHFSSVDPGLLSAFPQFAGNRPLLLEQRFIPPDIEETRLVTRGSGAPQPGRASPWIGATTQHADDFEGSVRVERQDLRREPQEETIRRPAIEWLLEGQRTILLGRPGSGKSALLRFIALELLSEQPRLESLARRWSGYLPIWIPFGMWTRRVQRDGSRSLVDLVMSWLDDLHKPDAEPLKALVRKAFEDRRVLLLVDGLDEWSSEQAALTTLGLLTTFVATRELPAILTSRPHGYQRLGSPCGEWRSAELAGFSKTQQHALARLWFTHFAEAQQPDLSQHDRTRLEMAADHRAEAFVAELNREARLTQLGAIPLLLTSLIGLSVAQVRLPQNRFKAYAELTEILIERHPRRRGQASMASNGPWDGLMLAKQTIEDVLAHLAYHMHQTASEGVLEKASAQRCVVKVMGHEFDLPRAQAEREAEKLLAIGAEAIGLLVEKAPGQIGFLHRTFQEFFAAKYLSTQALEDQRAVVRQRCEDPQWHEVLLGLFFMINRKDELDQFLDGIEQGASTWLGQISRTLLLTETAFGDFRCTPGKAKQIASRAFQEIETGTWMPLRSALLDIVLAGAQNDVLSRPVSEKLNRWFPSRINSRCSLFEAMSAWAPAPEVFDCLWHALLNDDERDARAAARTLATIYRDDEDVGNRLLSLIRSPISPETAAVLLEALVEGWSTRPDLEPLLAQALSCPDIGIQVVAIRGRIIRGEHGEVERDTLLSLALHRSRLPWMWREDVSKLLAEGCAGDTEVKAACIASLRCSKYDPEILDEDIAFQVLLTGFSGDLEVAEALADLLLAPHPSPRFKFEYFQMLAKNFRDAAPLGSAIDTWISREHHIRYEVAPAALVSRSSRAKACLLQMLNDDFAPHWAAGSLMEGWGINDPEVAAGLCAIAKAPPTIAEGIAQFLPDVLPDRDECRNRLMDIVIEHPRPRHFVLEGLAKLGCDHSDTEVMDLVLEHRAKFEPGSLIRHFGGEARVRALALDWVEEGCAISASARLYAKDPEVRERILRHACPLAIPLRQQIARSLSRTGRELDSARKLLSRYVLEADTETSTIASIGFHEAVASRETETEPYVKSLAEHWNRYWLPNLAHAPFVGFIALDRLDAFVDLRSPDSNYLRKISAFSSLHRNATLLSYIAVHWSRLEAILGPMVWSRLRPSSEEKGGALSALSPHIDDTHPLKEQFIEFMCSEESAQSFSSGAILRFSQLLPHSDRLRELCLRIIDPQRRRRLTIEELITAAEVLGRQFGGNAEVEAALGQLIERQPPHRAALSGAIIALCEGWPESKYLEQLVQLCQTSPAHWSCLSTVARCQLICLKGTTDANYQALVGACQTYSGEFHETLASYVPPVVRRITLDSELYEHLFDRLVSGKASPGEKASLPRLLARARGIEPEVRRWCEGELDHQHKKAALPEIGLDMVSGRLRPVAHALLDVLAPLRR